MRRRPLIALAFVVLAAAKPAPPTAILTQASEDVTIDERGSTYPSRAYVLRVLGAGDRVNAPADGHAAFVCSSDRLVSVPAGGTARVTEEVCAAGAVLPAGTYQSLVPRGGRLRTVDGALVLQRATRRSPAPGTAILLSPRKTDVLSARPPVEWVPVAGAAEYELSVRGDVKFRATLTCPDAASGRCRAAYPASQPELPPGGIVSLRIAPRRSDGPHLGGGGDEVLWVRRLPDAEAAPILEGVKLIEQAPADGATRSLLLANLYAGHRLYADAILHYRTAAAELRGGEIDAALGDAYLATGLLEQAEDAYEDAVRDPAMLPTAAGYFGLGHVFYARGEFRQAGEQFDHAARIYEGEGFKNHGAAARVAAAQAWERAD